MSNDDAVNDALAALLEGSLSSDEQRALELRIQREPAVCAQWQALLRQDVLLGEVFSDEHFSRARETKSTTVSNPWRWALAVAACLALIAGVWAMFKPTTTTTTIAKNDLLPAQQNHPTLSQMEGSAQIERAGQLLPATQGLQLQTDDTLVIAAANVRVEVQFPDGSRISCDQPARWSWKPAVDRSHRVELLSGAVSALIEKQKHGAFVLGTPHARVTVVGTRFRLSVAGQNTTLELFEGSVRFQRKADGREISVAAEQRAVVGTDTSAPLAAIPLNAPTQPTARRVLLVTAEPLPFYAHDVAVRDVLQRNGFQVELTTFEKISTAELKDKVLLVVPSHKCLNNRILTEQPIPVIAWHNVWHQDLRLLRAEDETDHQLSLREVSWNSADAFAALQRQTQPEFPLNIYSSLPIRENSLAVLKLKSKQRSPWVLFEKDPASGYPARRAAFSMDIREGAGDRAPVEISEELFLATVRWCLSEERE